MYDGDREMEVLQPVLEVLMEHCREVEPKETSPATGHMVACHLYG